MTNKEYIRWLKLLDNELTFDALVDGKDKMDMHEMIWVLCEKLEQEPNEPVGNSDKLDYISRDMLLEKMADYVSSGYADSAEDFEAYSKIICELPSVKPQEQYYKDLAESYEKTINKLTKAIAEQAPTWIDAENPPDSDRYILLSFSNFSLPAIGRYEGNDEDGGSYYFGDDPDPCNVHHLIVNAWMELPERYEG